MGLLRAAIYRVCQCIGTRKTTKAESKWRAVKMPEKKRNQLVKTGPSVTTRESPEWNWLKRWMLTGPSSADLWGRLLLGHTRESDVLGLSQGWNRGKRWNVQKKTRAEPPILSSTGVEIDPLAVPQLHPIEDFWFFFSSRKLTRMAGTPKWRGFERFCPFPTWRSLQAKRCGKCRWSSCICK